MSNLIITVIAIGVMAIAVCMAAYYMGSTYENSMSSATSSAVLNQADQLSGVWKNFLVGNLMAPPADWLELIQAGYIEQVLQYSPSTGSPGGYFQIWPDDAGVHYYLVADLGDPAVTGGSIACNRLLGLANGTKLSDTNVPATIPDFSPASLDPVTRFTCGPVAALPRGTAILQIGEKPEFPLQTHNILIYRLS